ncbi:cyclic nucleotide-binding domain protein [Leptospira broomii serovar Hurstbridge str. 5399]|uniref:Cyclic nucleotide-binding domain protein n=1 Tax=Leptospira broomii serovar Hurstbridge str. 5399 TaxID=1049789 RepID=T0FBA7_9LEPT|nr:cyclic nucleotide-binding domain-containing protein [Leptospira broomii]EQA45146.1 cyclic nucleotide-binding domain protein [Leptospira broomii serovar Hurstbridge str. 5399]
MMAADLLQSVTPVTYERGSYIFREGDLPNGNMYFLFQGQLRVSKRRDQNQERPIKDLSPGEFFGEISLISGKLRTMSVQVISPTAKVGILNKAVFGKLEQTNPQFLLLLLKNTIEKLNRAEGKLESLYSEIHRRNGENPVGETAAPTSELPKEEIQPELSEKEETTIPKPNPKTAAINTKPGKESAA